MHRLAVLAATLLVTTGCEEQEAVPLSTSVPMALLLAVALVAVVVGGWLLVERRTVRRPPATARPAVDGLRSVVALLAVLAAGAAVALALLFVNAVAFGYRETTYQVLSWDDTVGISWFLVGAGGLLALGELRLAAALVRGSKVAPWIAGAQIALIAVPGLASGL